MAYYGGGRYGRKGKSSFGGSWADNWTPAVDKNLHYRTNDIFNGIFKKRVRLVESKGANCTDGEQIAIRFKDPVKREVTEDLGQQGEKFRYRLNCGHAQDYEKITTVGATEACHKCGEHQSYLALQHEWSHLMFGSFRVAWALFCRSLAAEYAKQVTDLSEERISKFIDMVVNAFDDIRCNSLLEKWYKGAAGDIWLRWQRLGRDLTSHDYNRNFIHFLFAVALGIETDPAGPFEPCRPVVEWGMQRVRYKGPANMLAIVRAVLDRCIGTLAQGFQPPPALPQPIAPAVGMPGGGGGEAGTGAPMPTSGAPNSSPAKQGDQDSPDGQIQTPAGHPSAATMPNVNQGLDPMMSGAKPHDPTTAQDPVTPADAAADPDVQRANMLVNHALNGDLSDLPQFDQAVNRGIDPDVQRALQQLQDGIAQVNLDHQLTADARAKIFFLDVEPRHITRVVTLGPVENRIIESLRSTFHRVLGAKRCSRVAEGQVIDVNAAIQYLIQTGLDDDSESYGNGDPNIFHQVSPQQGFYYLILCDMSGSMSSCFSSVEKASSMLRESLDFPFVQGAVWGFRGGQDVEGRESSVGEVWIYRYDPQCNGYTGEMSLRLNREKVTFEVGCGGITPMNSALRVAMKHLIKHAPTGMAKRLFLLTDGAPFQQRTTGGRVPESLLRKFVANEIRWGRQHGVPSYSILIGQSILDHHALKMFGPRKFWRRVQSDILAHGMASGVAQPNDEPCLLRVHHDLPSEVIGADLNLSDGQSYSVVRLLDAQTAVLDRQPPDSDSLFYTIQPPSGIVGRVLFDLVKDNFVKYLKIHG